ncbi:MAG: biosynthetic alanine racemase [Pseudomonadota bacterium]
MAEGPIRAVISRSAWRHNLARLKAAAPRAKVLAVIKANAYGHGAIEAARTLDADAFGVARLGEGLELRTAGIVAPIVLMEGVFSPDELAVAIQYRFDLVVHSAHQIDWLRAHEMIAATPLVIWLKVNTGMNRLGFDAEELSVAAQRLQSLSIVKEIRLMTHFATADEPDHPLTERQLALFEAASAGIAGVRSLGNSAGILSGAATQGHWIRAGIALYGSSPTVERTASELGLEPVMSLQSEIIALRELKMGDSVGYGATWVAARPTRLAIVAAGYADGFPRSCPSGTPVLVNGHRATLVGRVSMDMITVDVTDIPSVSIGDPVVLWGGGVSVDEIARCAATIGYELLCRVTGRVPRVYID